MQRRTTGRLFRDVFLCSMFIQLAVAVATTRTFAQQEGRAARPATSERKVSQAGSGLTGVYRIDPAASDKLYSVVEGASSNLPYGEQQRFFIDLAVRLTPPDLIAIERKGRTVSIASSRAARITFEADGVTQRERAADGHLMRTKAMLAGDRLTVSTDGSSDDSFTVTFEPIDGGRRLRVVRRIYAAQLTDAVVVQSVYDRISDVAEWSIYGEPRRTETEVAEIAPGSLKSASAGRALNAEAEALRVALNDWVAATNARDIGKLVSFYTSEVKAFYLSRNVPRSFVRTERARDFASLSVIDVRAEEPEIIFGAGTAVMRFRKRYSTEAGGRRRVGQVIQELRWRKTAGGWRIFSERDVRVIR